jgi:AraC family transcriptional activator of pobA
MIEYVFSTRLNGNVVLTYHFHESKNLLSDKSLYKFIWVQSGRLVLEIDHVPMVLEKDEILPLTPLHHIEFKEVEGDYLSLLFNSNFYCIYGHDNEVSCNGFLFQGSHVMRLKLSDEQSALLHSITNIFEGECHIKDDLQEEMLRIVLKRFIITCTRIARNEYFVHQEMKKNFELVRQFNVLVDNHFKEMKQVQDYADLLHRSPKTLSNLFAEYGYPSPLQVIHERIGTEAKRLLLYSNKSAKEIADILGFEDLPAFSRFFKKKMGKSITEYRKTEKRE